MAKILCVEDSTEFYIYLTSVLRDHTLIQAETLNDAFKLLQNGRESFDMVLLDISLPDGNGMKALPGLKETFSSKMVPIIILSSDNDVISKVAAFGIGADDYVAKPFDASEFRARIEARLRFARALQDNMNQIKIGDLYIDSNNMSVEIQNSQVGRESVQLTPYEFKILKIVSARPGQVFTRDQLLDQVWGLGKHVTQRTVDAHVSHLRRKIANSTVSIETVLSVGYKAEVRGNS